MSTSDKPVEEKPEVSSSSEPVEEEIDISRISSTVQHAEGRVNKLIQTIMLLPKIDKEGSSECPFAEELYAKKEEEKKVVLGELNNLISCQKHVTEAIGQCNKNRSVIETGQQGLHGDKAKGKYSEAEQQLDAENRRLHQLRRQIDQVIEAARNALRLADLKKWPGENEPGAPGWAPNEPGNDETTLQDSSTSQPKGPIMPATNRSPVDKELDNLFDITSDNDTKTDESSSRDEDTKEEQ